MRFNKLGNFISIVKGKKHLLAEKPSESSKRLILIDDLRNDDNIKLTDDKNGTEVTEKDILIAWDGANAGTIGYNKSGFIGSTIAKLRINEPSNYYTPFLGRFLQSQFSHLRRTATGATIPHINRKALERIKLPTLAIDDQIRIATILSHSEALIAKRKESIRLLDELVKSVFLEMFGDPVRNEKGWAVTSLNKLGSVNRGVSKHRPRNAPELLGGKYPLIQTGEVANSSTFITSYTQTYSDIGFKQSKLWPAGTLCITIAANIAKTGILTFDSCFPDSMVGLICNEKEANALYLHFLFSFFQRILEKNAPQAAQKNINLEILRNLKVPKPPLPLQTQFADIVEKAESLKSKYEASLTELENLYNSLSQRAFRGELDLSKVPVDVKLETESISQAESTLEDKPTKIKKDTTPKAEEETTKQYSKKKLIKIIKHVNGRPFSFKKLWDELENTFFEKNPKYDEVKDNMFDMLKGDKPILSQAFDKTKKEILLSVKE